MDYPNDIKQLIAYATSQVTALNARGELQDIDILLAKLGDKTASKNTLTHEQARGMIKWNEERLQLVFTNKDIAQLKQIIHKIIDIAVKSVDKNPLLLQVAHILHPLLSQDIHTRSIGWDLEEYMDWYFTDPSIIVRQQSAQELLGEWDMLLGLERDKRAE